MNNVEDMANMYQQAKEEVSRLEQQLEEANTVIDYYLPILEERLSCGAYARQYLAKFKIKE